MAPKKVKTRKLSATNKKDDKAVPKSSLSTAPKTKSVDREKSGIQKKDEIAENQNSVNHQSKLQVQDELNNFNDESEEIPIEELHTGSLWLQNSFNDIEYGGEDHLEDQDLIRSQHLPSSGESTNSPKNHTGYNFNPLTTEALYYIDSSGDIINKVVISDPAFSIPSSISSISHQTNAVPADEDEENPKYSEWDIEDENEEEYITRKYSDVFENETEQQLTVDELTEIRDGLDSLARSSAIQKRHGGFHYSSINLSERGLHDLSSIEQFTALKIINVSKNLLKDMRPLGGLPNLIKIDASNNQVGKFLEIHSEKPLPMREVNFSRNVITELVELKTYWALSVVNLSYNQLTHVDGFQDCAYLRVLNLSHNEIISLGNMNCPSLIVLLLKYNKLTNIDSLEGCVNLRYLNVSNNMIKELHFLKRIPNLMEFRAQENDFDLLEIEYLKCLLYLSHLWISPNPCLEVGLPRSMLIFMLPQVKYLDGIIVTSEEILQAQNTFNPSFSKLACEDHTNLILDKACRSANASFDEFCKTHPLPPILLLVGSSKSNAHELAMSLKEKFKHQVVIGGVHSTATTIESGDQSVDIPVSMESFLEMKNHGEFLATSHILGRVCGFATSQIVRAAERGGILVVHSVPLEIAISLKKWRLSPKLVLILPSKRPKFNVDEFLEAEAKKEKERLEHPSFGLDELIPEPEHEHKIKFARRSLPAEHHDFSLRPGIIPQPILKIRSHDSLNDLDNEQFSDQLLNMMKKTAFADDTEKDKEESHQKIVFPKTPKLRFSVFVKLGEAIDEMAEELNDAENNTDENGAPPDDDAERNNEDPVVADEPSLATIETHLLSPTSHTQRHELLASVLLQKDQVTSSQCIPDMLMSLPTLRPTIETKVLEADRKKALIENKSNSDLIHTDEAYYMEPSETSLTNEKPESKKGLSSHRALVSRTKTSNPKGRASEGLEFIVKKPGSGGSDNSNEIITASATTSLRSGVKFSEKNLSRNATEVTIDEAAEERIRARKPTSYIPSTHVSSDSISSGVHFSEGNLSRIATEIILDQAAEERIRARKPTSFVPSTHHSNSTGSTESDVVEPKPDSGGSTNSDLKENLSSKTEEFNEDGSQSLGDLIIDKSEAGTEPDENPPDYKDEEQISSTEPDSHYLQNHFKHRDAMEKAILKTREDYHQYHLDNPGFFSVVLDTSDFENCDQQLELIIEGMLERYKNSNAKKFRSVSSYAGECGMSSACAEGEKAFMQHRLEQLKWCNHEWNTGYQHPLQHMKNKHPSNNSADGDASIFFKRRSCPHNLFDTKTSRHYSLAKVNQLEKAGELRRQREIRAAKKSKLKRAEQEAQLLEMNLNKNDLNNMTSMKDSNNGIELNTKNPAYEEGEFDENEYDEDEDEDEDEEYNTTQFHGFKNEIRFTHELMEEDEDEDSFTLDD